MKTPLLILLVACGWAFGQTLWPQFDSNIELNPAKAVPAVATVTVPSTGNLVSAPNQVTVVFPDSVAQLCALTLPSGISNSLSLTAALPGWDGTPVQVTLATVATTNPANASCVFQFRAAKADSFNAPSFGATVSVTNTPLAWVPVSSTAIVSTGTGTNTTVILEVIRGTGGADTLTNTFSGLLSVAYLRTNAISF